MGDNQEQARSGFIAGPIADTVFVIAAPLLAVIVFIPFRVTPLLTHVLPDEETLIRGNRSLTDAFIHVVIFAHLAHTWFRSHLNRDIFKLYPLRFTVVPIALFAALMLSSWTLALVAVVAIWWDVYHSAMQTFGFARIYDIKRGNDAQVGRNLDFLLNLVLYAGPILGGVSFMTHLTKQNEFLSGIKLPELATAMFTQNPITEVTSRYITFVVVGVCIPFCVYYIYAYWRLHQKGYKISFQKVFLLAILAVVSLTCWGFDSFGEAFFIMNFFHAWQYFFIVWYLEKKNITSVFGLNRIASGRQISLAIYVFVGVAYGVFTMLDLPLGNRTMLAIILVCSIMHFWYDGFIWSVRKGQI